MPAKLIETTFRYTITDEFGKQRHDMGSYLGRKKASVKTLRKFLLTTMRKYVPASRLTMLEPIGSGVSRWIAQ